jgi:hypothetical protein
LGRFIFVIIHFSYGFGSPTNADGEKVAVPQYPHLLARTIAIEIKKAIENNPSSRENFIQP